MATGKSPTFEGRFGRMFGAAPHAKFGATDAENIANLTALAAAMTASFDPPSDGPDPEESGIPAFYTYFGQFIDHDLTFDPASSLQKKNDPDALVDFRTPAFDLDNVYGRGPNDQPYMYDGKVSADNPPFLLGDDLHGGTIATKDLPRNSADPRRALIGDPRNDENSIVSQLQGLFLRFHNRMRDEHPQLTFGELQNQVRFHYQYLVINDFLPRIVHSSVLEKLKDGSSYRRGKLEHFRWKKEPFMPVEFSVAAYRLGHSMIRPGYRLNDGVLQPIFSTPAAVALGFTDSLAGFRAMNPDWGIDWGRFVNVDIRKYDGTDDDKKKRLQFAYRIDTSLVNPLANLPPEVASNPSILALRNLERGWRMGLPSGQSVARAMGEEPLADADILIGKGVDQPDTPPKSIVEISPVFAGNCPLWTYILAEAMHYQEKVKVPVVGDVTITTPRLGPVGGRIVAEVVLGLLFGDRHSLLNLHRKWQPDLGAGFALKDFVNFALGK
jgi:hypothetical protein